MVSVSLVNWEQIFNITRNTSSKGTQLFLDWTEISEDRLSQKLMNEWFNIWDFYKNYLYLPQDDVYKFLIDKKERWNIDKLLKPENEESVLRKLKVNNEKLPTTILKGLEKQIEILKTKIIDIQHEINQNPQFIEIKRNDDILYNITLFWDKYEEIQLVENSNQKISLIKSLVQKNTLYKNLLLQRNHYIYERLLDRQKQFLELESFIQWDTFLDFFESFVNRGNDSYKFKDIDSTISNNEKDILLIENLLKELHKILKDKINTFLKFDWSKVIPSIITIDYQLLSKYDESWFIQSSIKDIQNLVQEKKSEIQQYWFLYTNIDYIFNNVSWAWFKSIEVLQWKTEKFCPTCWSEFTSYEELKNNIFNQLKYFEIKSKDTKIISSKIESLISSGDFIKVLEKVNSEKNTIDSKNKTLQITKRNLDTFSRNEYYSNQEIGRFILWIDKFSDINISSYISNYKQIIQDKLEKYKIDTTVEFMWVSSYYKNFLSILWLMNVTDEAIEWYEFIELWIINNNLLYLDNEESYLSSQLRNYQLNLRKSQIKYLEKRIKILDYYNNYYIILHEKLNFTILEYIKNTISQIKIPVYIFSRRILKTYEWDSIFLNYDNSKWVVINSWHFKRSPYYQYSQWQLTAVMLSILLALNITISNKTQLNLLLIDDPIQTLDDLNELSFVNLLRYQFSDKQIIISTHESDFSSYIRYKFWRLYWDMSHKNIDMKSIFLKQTIQ